MSRPLLGVRPKGDGVREEDKQRYYASLPDRHSCRDDTSSRSRGACLIGPLVSVLSHSRGNLPRKGNLNDTPPHAKALRSVVQSGHTAD
jgi:hypothetical protein